MLGMGTNDRNFRATGSIMFLGITCPTISGAQVAQKRGYTVVLEARLTHVRPLHGPSAQATCWYNRGLVDPGLTHELRKSPLRSSWVGTWAHWAFSSRRRFGS